MIRTGTLLLLALLVPAAAFAAVDPSEVVSLTNRDRADAGLSPLARNALLDRAAQAKADDMAGAGYYAHVSPDGKTPVAFIEQTGYRYRMIGENLDVNATSARSAETAWMNSSGHRANILRPEFTEIGVGVAEGRRKGAQTTFVVQMFAAPLPPAVTAVPTPAPAPVPAPKPVSAPKPAIVENPLAESVKEVLKPITEPLEALLPPAPPEPATTSEATSSPLSYGATNQIHIAPRVILLDPKDQPAYVFVRPAGNLSPTPAPQAWRLRLDQFLYSLASDTAALLRFIHL